VRPRRRGSGALWKRIDVALAAKEGFPKQGFVLAAMGHFAELVGNRSELHADMAVLMAEKKLRGARTSSRQPARTQGKPTETRSGLPYERLFTTNLFLK
jgi:hypothetical protein